MNIISSFLDLVMDEIQKKLEKILQAVYRHTVNNFLGRF